jgi:TRAP-type uncharacterized transport system substrate-binding protein
LLLAALGWGLATLVRPAIQRTIVITTGADNGIYRGFADRYAPILKRDGITLVIRSSSGSVENYERLKNPDSEYEVGFIQSGTTSPKETDHLQTIAAVSYEPIWVFYRGDITVNRLVQLRGKRIAIGVSGSGLLNVAQVLLSYSGVTRDNTSLMQMDAVTAYQGLEDGKLDAAFFIGRPDAPMQHTLLNSKLKWVLKGNSLQRPFFAHSCASSAAKIHALGYQRISECACRRLHDRDHRQGE